MQRGWDCCVKSVTNLCMQNTPESYIPPTLTTKLTRQGQRVWPQTSYWLLTMVEWSVHIPTLIHYVQKTQQRKNSGLTVSGGLRTAESVCCAFPKPIVFSSPLTDCYVPHRHKDRVCVSAECLGISWAVMNATFPLSCVTGCGRLVDDEVMEMLGGHNHCDAGWLLLWNCHLPKRSVARGQFSWTVSASQLPSTHPHTHSHTYTHTNPQTHM